jgi:hypothetical protein
MPNLERPFIGKYVKLKIGLEGYIKEIRAGVYCEYVIQCYGSDAVVYVGYTRL